MSEFTFNIADYRPLFRVRTHDQGPAVNGHRGLVVVSSGSEPRGEDQGWLESRTQVVEIRAVREEHRSPRRAKVLRFNNPASHRVYMMPAHHATPADDDNSPDSGPMVA